MVFLRYLFPGFIIGPVIANFVIAAVEGSLVGHDVQISLLTFFFVGLAFSLAFYGADRLILHR